MAFYLPPISSSFRTAAIYAGVGAVVLFSSFGLGYLKGRAAQASMPTVRAVESSKVADTKEKGQGTKDSKTAEDVLITREVLPAQKMPDGSVRRQTRIRRQAVKSQQIATTSISNAQVEERAVERVAEAKACPVCPPCGGMANPFVSEKDEGPKAPRFIGGPLVGRDFSVDKTVFGGSIAVRTGPIYWRLTADTHPMIAGSFEVGF